jgi:hypothetical protein
VVALSILVGAIGWADQAWAGWVIEQVLKGDGGGARQQVVLQANRIKTLTLGEGGKPVWAFILDLGAETMAQVNYARRSYAAAPIREVVQSLEEAEDATPQSRSMKDRECPQPRIEVRKTDQRATIAGYPAVRYEILSDAKLHTELWLTKEISAWQEVDIQKLAWFGAQMAKGAPCSPSLEGRGLLGTDPSWNLADQGFPVRVVNRTGRGGTTEVVKAERREVPSSEFLPPEGFMKKTFHDLMPH